jgi:hypothetical protein
VGISDGWRPLLDAGQVALALAAIVTTVGIVSRIRPVRWLWRRVVIDPAAGWFRDQVEEVVGPKIAAVHRRIDRHMVDEETGAQAITERLDTLADLIGGKEAP